MVDFPSLDEALRRAQAAQAPQHQANSGFFAPALSAGYHEAAGQLASVGEAAGHALGMPGLEKWAAGHAAQQKKAAQAADNPEYANAAWYSPTGALYHLVRGVPQLAAGLGAAALAPEGAGLAATIGAGALGAAPFVMGSEVQAAKEGNHGELTGEGIAKAAAIAAPMSALYGFPAANMVHKWAPGVQGTLMKRIGSEAGINAGAMAVGAGVNTALDQQAFGDPNMSVNQRADQIVQAALHGAAQGGLLGGAFGALRGPQPQPAPKPEANLPQPQPQPGFQYRLDGVLGPEQRAPQVPGMEEPGPASAFPRVDPLDQFQPMLPFDSGPASAWPPRPAPYDFAPVAGKPWRQPDGQLSFLQRPDTPVSTEPTTGMQQGDLLSGVGPMPGRPEPAPYDFAQTARPWFEPGGQGTFLPQEGPPAPPRPITGDLLTGVPQMARAPIAPEWSFGDLFRSKMQEPEQPSNNQPPVQGPPEMRGPPVPDAMRPMQGPPEPPAPEYIPLEKPYLAPEPAAPSETLAGTLARVLDVLRKPESASPDLLHMASRVLEKRPEMQMLAEAEQAKRAGRPLSPEQQVLHDAVHPLTFDGVNERKAAEAELARQQEQAVYEQAWANADPRRVQMVMDKIRSDPDWRNNLTSWQRDLQQRLRLDEMVAEEQGAKPVEPTPAAPAAAEPTASALPEGVTGRLKGWITRNGGLEKATAKLQQALGDGSATAFQTELAEKLGLIKAAEPAPAAPAETPPRPSGRRPETQNAPAAPVAEPAFVNLEGGAGDSSQAIVNRAAFDQDVQAARLAKMRADALNRTNGPSPISISAQKSRRISGFDEPSPDFGASVNEVAARNGGAHEVLKDLATNHEDPQVRAYAQHFIDMGVNPKLNVGLPADIVAEDAARVARGENVDFTPAAYNEATGIHLNDPNVSPRVFLHEMQHAATVKAFAANTPGARAFTKFYERALAKAPEEVKTDPALKHAFSDAEEFNAELQLNPRLQAYLKAQAPNLWASAKNAIFRMLGMPERQRTMFDHVLDLSRRVEDETRQLKLTNGDAAPAGMEPRVGGVPDTLVASQRFVKSLDDVKQWLDNTPFTPNWARKVRLGWSDIDAMVKQYGHLFDGALQRIKMIHETAQMIKEREGGVGLVTRGLWEKARAAIGVRSREYDDLLVNSNLYGYDPRKDLASQPKDVDPAAWPQWKRDQFNLDRQRWNNLPQQLKDVDVKMRATLDGNQLAAADAMLHLFHRRLKPETPIAGFERDTQAEAKNSLELMDMPEARREFWRSTVMAKIAGLDAYGVEMAKRADAERESLAALLEDLTQAKELAKQQKADKALALNDEAKKQLDAQLADKQRVVSETESRMRLFTDAAYDADHAIKLARKSMRLVDEGVPYAPFGRNGEHYVYMRLKTQENGAVDPAALARMHALVGDKYGDLVLDKNPETNAVMVRFQTRTQRDNFRQQVGNILQAENLLAPMEKGADGKFKEYNLHSGMVNQAHGDVLRGMAPRHLERLINEVSFTHLPEAEQKLARQQFHATMLDLLPPDSIRHTQERRQGDLGFNRDMMRSFEHVNRASAASLASLWKAGLMDEELAGMANKVDEYKAMRPEDADVAQQVLQEMTRRQAKMPWRAPAGVMQGLLQLNHAYFLTLSPAYVTELVSQIPTLMLPQFGRDYGYLQAAKAISGSATDAFRVVRALIQSGHGADALLTHDALKKAGLSEERAKFIMDVANRGGLEVGGWTHAMLSDAPSLAKNRAMQAASVVTVAAEVMPRAMAALAARDLYLADPKKARMGLDAYVAKSIEGAMMNWQSDMQARNLSTGGFAGPVTPLVTKFMSFQTKMLNRLYTEADMAYGSLAKKDAQGRFERGEIKAHEVDAEAAASRVAARKFLLGHLTAVGVLAGSLGMPILPVAASAASTFANFVGGTDKYDAEESWRHFLTSTFGEGMGEVIAKGAPRALGLDLHEHVSEARLLPFADLLTDKRKWSDAFESAAWKSLGSPFSMMAGGVKGVDDIAHGHILHGMQELVPSGLKNPLRAWRMTQYGYEDTNGHKLPLGDPSTMDIAAQFVGMTPAKLARYEDAEEALRNLQDRRNVVVGHLSENVLTAYNHKDAEGLGKAQKSMIDYVLEHPWAQQEMFKPIQNAMHQQVVGGMFGVNKLNPRDLDQLRVLRAYGMPQPR